jgi:hypothetical protein
MIMQARARGVFENLNTIDPDPKMQSFAVNAGWFQHFKVHCGFHSLQRGLVEAAAADLVAVGQPPVLLQVTMEKHVLIIFHTPQHPVSHLIKLYSCILKLVMLIHIF